MYSQTDLVAAFDAEAGDVASLADTAAKTLWFNQGQSRLLSRNPSTIDVTWIAAATTIALPTDFVQLRRIAYLSTNNACDTWRVLNQRSLVYNDEGRDYSTGALAAGSARVFYDAEWPDLSGSVASILSRAEDTACLYYTLHRFYRKLASNRAYYKRYATLAGANAVSVSDLQAEADRYLQDFTDARADVAPAEAALFFGSE